MAVNDVKLTVQYCQILVVFFEYEYGYMYGSTGTGKNTCILCKLHIMHCSVLLQQFSYGNTFL